MRDTLPNKCASCKHNNVRTNLLMEEDRSAGDLVLGNGFVRVFRGMA
jgi:hypothetical protein